MKLSSLEGNRQWLDGGAMFGHAPKAMWSRWVDVNEDNCIPLACRTMMLEKESQTILFELGVGDYMEPKLASRYGIENSGAVLIENLKKAGKSETDVDVIVLSHLHFDHAGGLVPSWPATKSDDWTMRFPNAKIVVSQEQYKRSLRPHLRDRASYIPLLSEKLESSGRLVLVGENGRSGLGIDSFIQFHFTNGHTPGLMHSLVSFKKEKIFFCSDIVPGKNWLNLPIVTAYDRNAELSVNEKKEILERAENEGWVLYYTHDPDIIASRVGLNQKGKYEAKDEFKDFSGLK